MVFFFVILDIKTLHTCNNFTFSLPYPCEVIELCSLYQSMAYFDTRKKNNNKW